MHEYFTNLILHADVLLYGRKTYQLMVPYWPDAAKKNDDPSPAVNDFALAFDAVKSIVVVSRTLESVDGDKTRIIRSNMQEEILKLKQEPGRDILLGGVDVPSQLMQLGLVDEFHFVVQPIIAGDGRRLMEGIDPVTQMQLQLVDTKIFKYGAVALRYVKQ